MLRPYRPLVVRRVPVEVVISRRQAQCLDFIVDGLTNAQIGARLGISEDSTKTHVRRMLAAIGASNRAHAVGLALTGRVIVLVSGAERNAA